MVLQWVTMVSYDLKKARQYFQHDTSGTQDDIRQLWQLFSDAASPEAGWWGLHSEAEDPPLPPPGMLEFTKENANTSSQTTDDFFYNFFFFFSVE